MKVKNIVTLAVAVGLLGTSTYAEVIDFQDLEHIDYYQRFYGYQYIKSGFEIAALGSGGHFYSLGTATTGYSGSTALFNGEPGGTTQLSKIDGSTFDFISIDLAELMRPEASVTFIRDGGHSQTFTLDGITFGAETFFFDAGFRNSTAVTWRTGSSGHQFDNIVVNPIPEPSVISLMAIFCGGVVCIRRFFPSV